MMRGILARLALVGILACPSLHAVGADALRSPAPPAASARVKIFFDTDMMTDCDDAGAMAVLHALADKGECEILATVASVADPKSIATVDAINRYYGRPGLPLGLVKAGGVQQKSLFTARVAAEFPHDVKSGAEVPDATRVYRDVLEQQPDQSVVIVTVGYLTNLRHLLQLPASEGHVSGPDLIRRKVKTWVCMGGNFIGHPPKDDLKLGNVNFQRDAASALQVIQHWPGTIVFAGREVCSVPSGLAIGANLAKTPTNNPVRRAYEHYFGGTAKNRHVADLATVLYAVRGLRDYWHLSEPGRMDLQASMTFEWKFAADGNQRYLLKRQRDGQPNDRYVEASLDELLVQPPQSRGIQCEGAYPLHLQGVATDGTTAIFWSWTDALVKTDQQGRLVKRVKADNHQGDLCTVAGKVYVAVNLGKFNEPAGQADSWVYVYDGATLDLLARHRVPELVHGAGGIAHRDGKFIVVGGLPAGVPENYLYEYDADFRFVQRHVLASGHTDKGIQTATWANGAWWFGCYGKPCVLLRADANFQFTGRWEFDASLGLEALPDGRLFIGQNTRTPGVGHVGRVVFARTDAHRGLVMERP